MQLAAGERERGDLVVEVVRGDHRIEHRPALESSGDRPEVEPRHDLRDRAARNRTAVRHQHHPFGQPHHLLDRMPDVDDRDPQLVAQPLDVVQDLALAAGVERGERLVEQQHPRARQQRAPDRDALLLAARQRGRPALEQRCDVEQVDHLVERRVAIFGRGEESAVQEILPYREMRKEPAFLEDVADAPLLGGNPHPARRIEQHLAVHEDAPRRAAPGRRSR